MSQNIRAIYENGVFRPLGPVDLPEHAPVIVAPATPSGLGGIGRSHAPLPGPPPGWRLHGIETAAGMLAESWTEEDDRIFAEIQASRERDSWREITP